MNEELKIIISAQINKLKDNVNKAKQEISGFKEQVQKASKDVDKHFKSIGESISKGLKKVGTTVTAAGVALLALGASTAEYRNEQAKLATAFEAAGSSASAAKETYNDLYRVLGDSGQATEAANHLAKLTTNEKELAEWTNVCQGIYATFGDSLPIEGLTEAANETAKVAQVTGPLADAINWATTDTEAWNKALGSNEDALAAFNKGVSEGMNAEDAFNEALKACNSEAEREKLIRETLNGLYSDAAAKYEENNAQVLAQNEANAKLKDTMAELGGAVAPVVTGFTNFASDALAVVTPYIQDLAETYMPVLSEVLEDVAKSLGDAFKWASQHKELLAVIGGIIAGITTAIGLYNAVAAIKATMDAAQVATLGALVAAYLAQAAAMAIAIAPYLLIVAAIAAVIAIIVLCVKHWDEIKAKVKEVWGKIKEWTIEAVDAVKNKFNEMKQSISEKVEAVKSAISEKFNAIKETMGNVMQAAKDTVSEKLSNIKSAYESHGGGIKGVVAATMEGIKGYYTAGYTFIDNLTGGKLSSIVNTIKNKMNSAKESVSNILESIKNKFSNIMERAKSIVSSAIEKIKGFFNFKWELPKLKMPHIKIAGEFSLVPPKVPKFSIDWYAKGGIFDSPALFGYGNGSIGGLGENGAEAIVPLEKNTQWLDRIATMLNDKMGGGIPIVLEVDGKVFAETAISTINKNTRQTGKLALNLI